MTSNPDDGKPTYHHKWNEDIIDQLEIELPKVEALLKKKLETLEKSVTLPPAEETSPQTGPSLIKCASRIISMLKRHTQAEDVIMKENSSIKKQLKRQQYLLKEVEMERDILLQNVHAHLEANSSLRVRLEEQRCQTGALQRQLHLDLEARIKTLETEKEHLVNLNLEKDQKLRKMALTMEETINSLKEKETEVLNQRNKDNSLINLLKTDLEKTLKEKIKAEEKYARLKQQVGDVPGKNDGRKGLRDRKRSLSTGDLFRGNVNSPGSSFPKPNQEVCSTIELFKTPEGSCKFKPTPVQNQLNSLRRDLLNLTRKLEALKLQLVSSGVIQEDSQPAKNLKRKANTMEEVSDDQKSEFKNLNNILQDAKNLNAKLQNLREEKQKVIDLNKKERQVQVAEKENEFSQTAHEMGPPPIGIFKAR